MTKIQAIRGMNDILPAQTPTWLYLERCFRDLVQSYGYQEIRFPILEQSQLFKRSIGEVTDIVAKEMYSFEDRNGDNLSLRPEGTAGCVRAAEQHGLLYNQQQRLWYLGPMFRHERPQKGRYRQFHQFGIEAFGMPGPDIDAELILLSARLWRVLDISNYLQLEINNIGSSQNRREFGVALQQFLSSRIAELDSDSQLRLNSNPLRILDSKVPETQALLLNAPALCDFVSSESRQQFEQLKNLLGDNGIEFIENPRLVRGLDYYNNAVFEWTTTSLGAQGTVCGGGRYDGLVEQLGGKATYAAGFAIGEERLVLMLEELQKVPEDALLAIDIYLAVVGEHLVGDGLKLAESLRQQFPELRLQLNCGGGKYNSQMKKAYSSGAWLAVILESEAGSKLEQVKLRSLDEAAEAKLVNLNEITQHIRELLR